MEYVFLDSNNHVTFACLRVFKTNKKTDQCSVRIWNKFIAVGGQSYFLLTNCPKFGRRATSMLSFVGLLMAFLVKT